MKREKKEHYCKEKEARMKRKAKINKKGERRVKLQERNKHHNLNHPGPFKFDTKQKIKKWREMSQTSYRKQQNEKGREKQMQGILA